MSKTNNLIATIASLIGILAGLCIMSFAFMEYIDPKLGIAGLAMLLGGIYTITTRVNLNYFDPNYKNTRKEGTERFDFTQNNGNYEIGKEKLLFRLNFANGDASHIWFNKPSAGIKDIGKAKGIYALDEVRNAAKYFNNSTNISVAEEEIVIIKNVYGNYAAIKILDVKATSHHDPIDEVTFQYIINPKKVPDFGF